MICTHIDFVIVVAREARLHFRCDIVRCAQTASEIAFKVCGGRRAHSCRELATSGQAKVSDAGVVGYIDEDVVRLEVAMDDAMAVDMAQTVQDLPEQTPGPVDIVIQAIPYQVTKGLGAVSIGRAKSNTTTDTLTCFSQYSI